MKRSPFLSNREPARRATRAVGLADVIATGPVRLRILQRYPEVGQPASGVPFALDIEVETDRMGLESLWPTNWFSSPWWTCKDAVVAAIGSRSSAGRVWGVVNLVTSAFDSCIGRGRLSFDTGFAPDSRNWIRLAVYEEGTTRAQIESGRATPLATTSEILLDKTEKQMRDSGMISDPTKGLVESAIDTAGSGTDKLSGLLKNATMLAVVGVGLFVAWPVLPVVAAKIKKAVS